MNKNQINEDTFLIILKCWFYCVLSEEPGEYVRINGINVCYFYQLAVNMLGHFVKF